MKDALRVGVRVRHSIFGITTYYKVGWFLSCSVSLLLDEPDDSAAFALLPLVAFEMHADMCIHRCHLCRK